MLTKTIISLYEIGPFAALLFLFIYLFALIGRELFAYIIIIDESGDYIYGDEIAPYLASGKDVVYPRINFNKLWNSLVSVFILVNGEDWNWIA